MLLIYGCFSTDTESESWQRFGGGAGLSQTQMRWIWETYLERPEQQKDWRAAPALAELSGLPPAHLIVGSLDPLLDDSHRLAARLKEAGVACELKVYEAIGTLRAYAFISERTGQESYDVHRLVRLAMRNWLAEEGELQACGTTAGGRRCTVCPACTKIPAGV